jgi:hypothetical protein
MREKFKSNAIFISGIFQILVGSGMLAIWLSLFLTGEIPEFQTEIMGITAHLMAEGVTALMLLFSGFHILLKGRKMEVLFHISYGALIYTLIASPGYFAQTGQWGTASLFLVLLAITAALLVAQGKQIHNP